MLRRLLPLALLAAGIGCGGGASKPSTPAAPVAPPPPPPSSGAVTEPFTVVLGPGATASGIDVVVPPPAASPAENAVVLGTTTDSQGSASNTGSTVHLGQTVTVLLFGDGLASSMQVTVTGPADIAISNIQGIKSTTGKAGIAFTAAVAPQAALGARTVILRATNDDITTFTGGLEVLP